MTNPAGGASIESPWLIQTTCFLSRFLNSGTSARTVSSARPYSRPRAARNGPPEDLSHQLHSVADSQDRDSQLGEPRVEIGCPAPIDRIGASGQDERLRRRGPDRLVGSPTGNELAIDAEIPDSAGDQLRGLASVVEHEDLFVERGGPAHRLVSATVSTGGKSAARSRTSRSRIAGPGAAPPL